MSRPRGYRGSTLMGFIILGVIALRAILFYQDGPALIPAIMLLLIFTLLYISEPWISIRFSWYLYFYFALQTCLVLAFTLLDPFLDFQTLLYIPLLIQAFHALARQAAISLSILYVFLVSVVLLPNLGLLEGIAFILLGATVCAFFISYDFLFMLTQTEQAESQSLLSELQSAHCQLQEYAAQAEELAAIQERNRLARELHDSASQAIFSITLTSQSARLLVEREPARVPEVLERLQEMTSSVLSQLRSLIAQLRPPQTS